MTNFMRGNVPMRNCWSWDIAAMGWEVNLTGRRLEWMNSEIIAGNGSTSNLLNYVPAMSTQYTYMLTNLHPSYSTNRRCDKCS